MGNTLAALTLTTLMASNMQPVWGPGMSGDQIVAQVYANLRLRQADGNWTRSLASKGGNNRVAHLPGIYWSGREYVAEHATYYLAKGQKTAEQNAMLRKWIPGAGAEHCWSLLLMFGSKSIHFPGHLDEDVEKALKEKVWKSMGARGSRDTASYLAAASAPDGRHVLSFHNITTRWAINELLQLTALAPYPEYANRQLKGGDTIAQRYVACNKFWARGLMGMAMHGLQSEFASGHYENRTWPEVERIYYYATDPVVHQRVKMFLDIFLIEIAQRSLHIADDEHVQCGNKSRAKSGGTGSKLEGWLKAKYGEQVGMLEAPGIRSYRPPVPAILLRQGGPRPEPVYVAEGRIPCEYDRRYASRRYNYVFMTPEYGIGCAMFNPDHFNSPPLNRGAFGSWSGVIFAGDLSDQTRRLISLEAYTGEKWNCQFEDVMVTQRWKGGYYGGWPSVALQRFDDGQIVEQDGWVFVSDGRAFGAVKVVDGGYEWKTRRTRLNVKKEYSPIIIQTGRKVVYGSYGNFRKQILEAPCRLEGNKLTYHGPYSPRIEFFTNNEPYTMPRIDGQTLEMQRTYAYRSPYLNSTDGRNVVTAQYGEWEWVYDFNKNTITECFAGRSDFEASLRPSGPSAEVMGEWDGLLREQVRERLRTGEAPKCHITSLRSVVSAIDEHDGAVQITTGGVSMRLAWDRLTARDKMSLAAASLIEGEPLSNALVGFYALLAGEREYARKHLNQALEFRELVEKDVGLRGTGE